MYECKLVLVASALNEGEFDRYAKDLNKTYKKELVALNPLLNEYLKIKRDTMLKRITVTNQINGESDSAKKLKLNNDLVRLNNDEAKKLLLTEKKLARWAEFVPSGVLRFLMRSRLVEIDLQVQQEELKKQMSVKGTLSSTAMKRMTDLIKNKQLDVKTRALKLKKMIANVDTKAEDKKVTDIEKKIGKTESDYDSSGVVDSREKKVQQQKLQKAKKSPLNQI